MRRNRQYSTVAVSCIAESTSGAGSPKMGHKASASVLRFLTENDTDKSTNIVRVTIRARVSVRCVRFKILWSVFQMPFHLPEGFCCQRKVLTATF